MDSFSRKRRDAVEEVSFSVGRSSLGAVLVASSGDGVVAILIGENSDALIDELQLEFPKAHLVPGGGDGRNLVKAVVAGIENPRAELDLPLDIRGTAFQRKVWRAVQEIPSGATSTYTEVAQKIGAPKAIRAVGSSCTKCRFAIAIPCHRVLRSDGSLAGGALQKVLLDREADALRTDDGNRRR